MTYLILLGDGTWKKIDHEPNADEACGGVFMPYESDLEPDMPPAKPRTNQDALLSDWKDVDKLSKFLATLSIDDGLYYYLKKNDVGNEWYVGTESERDAIKGWKEYLFSPAEDGK